jgi:hypothetical protein
MYFNTKSYLKSTRNHTLKHVFNGYSYRFLTTKKPSNRETTLTGIDFGNMRP